MILSDLSAQDLAHRLRGEGLVLEIPPIAARIQSPIAEVAQALQCFYGDYALGETGGFADFHIALRAPRGLRRWLRPQVDFLFDGTRPFKPLSYDQAFPMFEWGLNWCVANHCHQYLMIHAAVIERAGGAAILAAPPGSGKSTLCAGLVNRGWRLLSDELALVDPATARLVPIPRPVSLKNESIEVIEAFAPGALLGPRYFDTRKGTVIHMKPPVESIRRAGEAAAPAWIVFPRFARGAAPRLVPIPKARAVVDLADNSFNFPLFGETGFDTLVAVADACGCYEFSYGDLDDAVETFGALAAA